MSYLAIGSVTSALAQLLTRKLNKPRLLANSFVARVTTLPPDDERVSEDTGVNLFLYRVSENPALKNMPWRGDRNHPAAPSRTGLSLTLNYLLTAYSKRVSNQVQDDIIAHQLLGNAMAVLNDNPVLNDVHDADFDADVDAMFAAELRESFDKVKVSLVPIAMEEFSRIWTGLTKAYRLSVAYEVSLVQIGPLTAATLPPPPPQRAFVDAVPIPRPLLESVTPGSGPVGTRVTLKGSGFVAPGRATSLTVGGVTLEESDLISLQEDELVFAVPSALTRGPGVEIRVVVGAHESAAAPFVVRPWIASLAPMRGNTGLPVTIPFELPPGATVSARVDGQAVPAAPDAARRLVTVVIPAAIATNGVKPVSLIVTDGVATPTNSLGYEVLPAITSFTVAQIVDPIDSPPRTQVIVQGERLAGTEVQLRFGKLLARVGANASATTVTFAFDRQLANTAVPVSVVVDGRESNVLPRTITRLEPSSVLAGDRIAIVGRSLSGRAVVVHFGAQDVNVQAQPFAARFSVAVPAGLPAGTVNVSVTVDGGNTNTLPLTVTT
jgi:Pvc16 N-terminal domain/IPT/TIG domain